MLRWLCGSRETSGKKKKKVPNGLPGICKICPPAPSHRDEVESSLLSSCKIETSKCTGREKKFEQDASIPSSYLAKKTQRTKENVTRVSQLRQPEVEGRKYERRRFASGCWLTKQIRYIGLLGIRSQPLTLAGLDGWPTQQPRLHARLAGELGTNGMPKDAVPGPRKWCRG